MPTFLILLAAWLLDRRFGEPRRLHPLNGFAALASHTERWLNRPQLPAQTRRRLGQVALVMLLAPPAALTLVATLSPGGWLIELAILYLCLGGRSLAEHARAIARPLQAGDLPGARSALVAVVSRDPTQLDARGVATAATESTLENGNDAVFATLFWFLLAGAPGAVLHRLANTLDALWGYRSQRYADFGRAAARLDDLLAWVPARLTAATFALVSFRPGPVWQAVREQAPLWPGTNPGVVIASGAAALATTLGGPAPYAEGVRERPTLGFSGHADSQTLLRATTLVERGVWIWIACAAALWAPTPFGF